MVKIDRPVTYLILSFSDDYATIQLIVCINYAATHTVWYVTACLACYLLCTGCFVIDFIEYINSAILQSFSSQYVCLIIGLYNIIIIFHNKSKIKTTNPTNFKSAETLN